MDATQVSGLSFHNTESREEAAVRWHPLTRIGFRFSVVYFSLYSLTTHMLYILVQLPIPSPLGTALVQSVTTRVATKLFGFPSPLVVVSGSGDKPFDWVLAFCSVLAAALVTLAWSGLDRHRVNYVTVQMWFRLFLRFSLGASLVSYGMAKVFPNQMPYPQLTRLVEPYGDFSLMGVLWQQMGASPPYETFTGVVETVAGILLFIPGVTLLGAMLALAATGQVFIVNMTYDIPVKLFSFHLVLMSLLLIAPDLRRLARLFVLNRPVPPSSAPPLARSRTGRRIAAAAQLAMAAWLVGSNAFESWQSYRMRGPDAPKPPLYGIWDVETLSIDGVTRAPLITDYDRWRRVIVQTAAGITFQRMDDSFASFRAKVDAAAGTITLTNGGPNPANPALFIPADQERAVGRFEFRRLSAERFILEGDMDGRKMRMELQHRDRSTFRLVQSRFHWVQDYPFNR
jgi:uncharacterized membrane protein YphA (DoxX/SURF4 family)